MTAQIRTVGFYLGPIGHYVKATSVDLNTDPRALRVITSEPTQKQIRRAYKPYFVWMNVPVGAKS